MAILLKHAKNVTIADDATAAAAGQVVPSDWNASHNLTGAANTVLAFDGSGNSTELSTTGSGNVVLATSPTLVTPALGTPASGNLANCTFPTLNQDTTGTAAGLSATLAVASGGTGVTTVTGILKGNGTSAFSAATAGTDYVAPSACSIASGKTLTVNNSITLAGTDSTTMTFPSASASIGYLNVPQVGGAAKTSSYTAVLADAGSMIVMNGATLTATIPANSSVAFPVGTVLTFVNTYAGNLSIAITTDTMTLVNTAATTGTRTLAKNGIATAVKVSSTSWIISGSGLT